MKKKNHFTYIWETTSLQYFVVFPSCHFTEYIFIYFWPYYICKSSSCPSLQTACIYLKHEAIFSSTAHSGPNLTVTRLLFALGKGQRDDPQNKLDTKAKILFLNSPMLKKKHRMSLHFPFPLPTAENMDVVGATLDHSGHGTPLGTGRAIGQSSLPLWCHEASILITWRLGLFMLGLLVQFSSVQSLSHVWLCYPLDHSTPGFPVHHQLLKFTQARVHRVSDAYNHLIPCGPVLLLLSIFPSIRVFSSESALCIRWPSIGVSASTSVLPMNIQDWSLGWTGWISLQSKGLSRVFFNTTVQSHQFFALSFLYGPTLISIHDYWKNHSLD